MDRRRKVELFEEIRRVPVWGGHDSRGSEETEDASADGATGISQCDSTGAQDSGAQQSEAGAGERVHRGDLTERSGSAAEAAAHGASDLGADSSGASRGASGGSDGAALRAAAEGRTGTLGARDVRAAELRLGRRRSGGLVRGQRGVRGRQI